MERVCPKYDQLPEIVPGFRCSWEYFNSLQIDSSQKDQLGTLNFLTPRRKAQAAHELIVTGDSLSLDLPVDFFNHVISAFGGRPKPVHKLKVMASFSYDDSLDFNTQSASQWDGFRHHGFRDSCKFYNSYTSEDLEKTDDLGIHAWARSGGIFGRCVLIDFCAWADHEGMDIGAMDGYAITLEQILKVLDFQKSSIRAGDILLFRTGWLKWYNETQPAEQYNELCVRNDFGTHRFMGIAQARDFVEWIWDNQIAAVAGDQVALEATPPPENGVGMLHEHLLAGLGCPIGELWNTEQLSEYCRINDRFAFFLASTPFHLPGGVASPANAVALF